MTSTESAAVPASDVAREDRVAVEIRDHVAHVTMVRGDKHNALDHAMFGALQETADEVGRTAGVRAVVLSGEGPSFCSGLDFPSFMAAGMAIDEMLSRDEAQIANFAQRAAYAWFEVRVPVIAALHGNCLGGGLQIALAADIRIATPDARLSVMEMRYGLIPDMSISQTLPWLVSADVAKELVYTGRTFEGTEALELGVVTRLDADPLAAAQSLAAEIASKSPDAIRAAKKLLGAVNRLSPEEGLALEEELQRTLLGSPNQIAAVQAAMTKQAPEFEDPDFS